ncbi:hypothetical protein AVDCRST_MAG81-4286, partial [uncultured Synechococcales cyanobacterium]
CLIKIKALVSNTNHKRSNTTFLACDRSRHLRCKPFLVMVMCAQYNISTSTIQSLPKGIKSLV